MPLTARFEAALVFAARAHAGQERKGTGIPYVSHLLAVAALVLEQGGGEDEAIAALLHDAPEDQGGEAMLARIREAFGAAVAETVAGCCDTLVLPKPPWRARKERYIAALPHKTPQVRLVSCADKLHNARCVLADYRTVGEALWGRFNSGRADQLWAHRAYADAFLACGPPVLASELARTVADLERLAGAGTG
ncbi:MAG: HD domain-containing protein [Stellaceae bacterium]